MFTLRANAFQLPFCEIAYGVLPSSDTTIEGYYGADVNRLANEYVASSLALNTETLSYNYDTFSLLTGGVPFFPDLSFGVLDQAGTSFDLPIEFRKGRLKKEVTTRGLTTAVVLRDNLCQFILSKVQTKFIEERAAMDGVGLGTKERYQLARAKAESARIGSLKVFWATACDSPVRLTRDGLYVKASATYCGFKGLVDLIDASSSGLGSIVQGHKLDVIEFYRRIYPTASVTEIETALDDSGLLEWYGTEFPVYSIKATSSPTVPKSPFVRQLETATVGDVSSLMYRYLISVVGRAVSQADLSSLTSEFFAVLKRKGHSVAKSRLVSARVLLDDIVKSMTGFEAGFDFTAVLEGSGSWNKFANKTDNAGAGYHPLLWRDSTFSDGALSGTAPNGDVVSIDVPEYLWQFCQLVSADRNVCDLVVSGWDDFVASTYSASFANYQQTETTYTLKSVKPILKLCGVTNGMDPGDVIGVLE